MIFKDSVYDSFRHIFQHKSRHFLAILGICIGVAGITTLDTVSLSIKASILDEIGQFGLSHIKIYHDRSKGHGFETQPPLTTNDAKFLMSHYGVETVAPVIKKKALLSVRGKEIGVLAHYSTEDLLKINKELLIFGRNLLEQDLFYKNKTCVIGLDLAAIISPEYPKESIGQSISLYNQKYTIVGIIQPKEKQLLNSLEQKSSLPPTVYIPITTYLANSPSKVIDVLMVSLVDTDNIRPVALDLISLLEEKHPYNYKYKTYHTEINRFKHIMDLVSMLIYIAMGITLLVGGIGITNVMMISVLENIGEIGIRKAVGASNNDIFVSYLIYAVLLTVIGGLLGVVLGFFVGLIILNSLDVVLILSFKSSLFTTCGLIALGGLAGFYPAWRAMKLSIIEVLNRG